MRLYTAIFIFFVFGPAFSMIASTQTEQDKQLKKLSIECHSESNLGSCHLLLDFLKKNNSDPVLLQQTVMKLCEAHDAASCYALGAAAERANEIADAINWYRRSCDMKYKNGLGCAAVANIATKQKSKANASRWLEKACAQGHLQSCPQKIKN